MLSSVVRGISCGLADDPFRPRATRAWRRRAPVDDELLGPVRLTSATTSAPALNLYLGLTCRFHGIPVLPRLPSSGRRRELVNARDGCRSGGAHTRSAAPSIEQARCTSSLLASLPPGRRRADPDSRSCLQREHFARSGVWSAPWATDCVGRHGKITMSSAGRPHLDARRPRCRSSQHALSSDRTSARTQGFVAG